MRNVKAKNSLIVERGAKKTLKVFKPLVASSLALALGVSVGNADPTLTNTTNGGDTIVQPNTANGNIWITSSDGYYQLGNEGTSKKIWFSNLSTPNTPYYQYKDTNMNELHIGGSIISSVLSSDKGIKIGGANGNGTLTISMWLTGTGTPTPRTFTLDLGSVTTTYALYGNLVLDETGGNSAQSQFYGNFGGSGISGKLTLNTAGTSTLNFTQTTSSIGGGIRAEGTNVGTTSINAQDLTITNGGGDAVGVKGGTLNITATNLKLNRNRSDDNGTGLWGTGNAQINITLNDGGSLSIYRQNESTLGRVVLDANTQFALTLKGNATIKASFTGAYSSGSNTRTFNFGDTTGSATSSGAHTVTFQGEFTSSKGEGSDNTTDSNNIGIASIFNFQNDGFTFAFKNANEEFQGITFDNARNNAINFNANDSVFDLGGNDLTITGTLGVNLGAVSSGSATSTRTETTGTINTSSIASSGTTTITFNTDNSTLNLKSDRSGAINVSGGTTTINFTKSGVIGGAVNTSGGNTIINIADEETATISSGVNTSEGTTDIHFNGVNGVLAGAVSTSGGTTTIKVADTKSGTINGIVTTDGGSTNINFDTNSTGDKTLTLGASGNSITGITFGNSGSDASTQNKIILSQGTTSITNVVDIKTGQGLAFDLGSDTNLTLLAHLTNAGTSEINFNGNNGTLTSNVSTTAGTTSINFNSTNGILDGLVSTDGGNTTINIADSSSGTINGNISTPNGQVTLATIAFASGNGNKSLRLNGSSNALESITLRNTSTNNSLILSGGTTTISDPTTIGNGNSLNIVFEGSNTNFRNIILNSGIANINFNGSSGWFMQGIKTLGSNSAVTTINISNGSKGEIQGSITTTQGSTNINFEAGSDSKTLTLDENSNLTGITFGGDSIENTLIIINNATITNTTSVNANQALTFALNQLGASLTNALANNGGNLRVAFNKDMTSFTGNTSTSAGTTLLNFSDNGSITGAVSTTGGSTTISIADSKSGTISGAVSTSDGGSTTISFAEGSNAKSLNLQGANNTITSITSNGSNNTLKLDTTSNAVSVGVTNAVLGADSLSIAMGGTTDKVASITLNNANGESTLKAITLTETTSAVGDNVLNLNANKTTITDNLSIASGQGMTINLAGDNVELDSDIANENLTNLNFNGSAGTLTGAVSTTAGTTTISVANGKSGSISGAVTTADSGATTTIKFAEGSEAKSLTLGQDANTLTNITFGNGTSTNNTLTLNGSTTITSATTISANQGLTFDLVNNNINLTNTIQTQGGSTILNYNGENGTLTGNVSTSSGTTALNFNQSGRITGGVSTSGGATTISIGNAKTATIDNITSQNYGIGTSDGETIINFIGESTLAGDISTTGGTTTFNLGSSNSPTALATISGAITNSAENIFNVNATTTTLKNGDNGLIFSSGSNKINFGQDNSTLNWQKNDSSSSDIASSGTAKTSINFNSSNGILATGISTDGADATTTIKIVEDKSGTIQGAVSTTSGATNVNFDGTGTLTLQGSANQITSLTASGTASTYSTLVVDGYRNTNTTTIDSLTNGGNLNVKLTGVESKNVTLTIADGGASDKTISLNSVFLADDSAYNTLDLTALTNTTIEEAINVSATQGLNINLKNTTLTLTNGWATAEGGASVINVGDTNTASASSALAGGVVTLKELNLKGASTSTASMTLQNTSTTIGTLSLIEGENIQNTLNLDTASNAVNTTINNAISGSNLTITLAGTTDKKAELTLNNANGTESTINSLTLSNSSAVGENVFNLNANKTTIASSITIDSNEGLTINLADNTELASGITNSGNAIINFNGTTSSTLTGNISTNGSSKTTTFNVANSGKGFINGNIALSNSGANNVTIGNGGTLTLQGATNALTEVSSTISGILSLDGASNENGVSASVSSAITGDTTTLNFNGSTGRKAEMTLSNTGNQIKAITLGTDSTANKLILSTGDTSIQSVTTIANNQALTFVLADGSNVNLTNNISNAGITNLEFNGSDGILTGTLSTTAGTTTIKIADSKSGTITGAVTTTGGTTNIDFSNGSNNKTLTLGAGGNTITGITLGSNGTLTLSQGTTSINDWVNVATGKRITFNLNSDSKLAFANNVTNTSSLESLVFNIKGTNTISGDITTGDDSISDVITTFNVADSSTGIIVGNIFTRDNNATNITIGNGGTLTLQGENNQLTSVSSTTSGILKLDGANNGVNTSVKNAIENSTTTLNFNGSTGRKAEMTLSNTGNQIKAITLGSGAVENKLILSQGTTSVNDAVRVGENQALAFDLANGTTLTFTNNLSNTGGEALFNVKDDASSTIVGNILNDGGTNNVSFVGTGTLTLRGAENKLTNVSSTTSGTLSLDGNGSTGGVEASVSSAIENNTTTLNFNGTTGKKAEITLGASGNELKAITLRSGAVENKLILSQGTTSVNDAVRVGENQALAFDLANGTTLTFTSNLSNSGGNALFNVNNSASSTIVGSILNENGTNNVAIGENGILTLRGTTNQLTEVSSNTNGILSLDGNGSTGGVEASVSSAIENNTTTLNFNGTTGKKAEMTLSDAGNQIKAITLGSGAVENKLILSTGSTSVETDTTITTNQALTFDLANSVNLTNDIENTGGSANLEFNGSAGKLTGTLTTTAGTTTISVADEKSGTITGAVTTTGGATTTINFADGSNTKSLNLQGANNTITTITSGGSGNNTLLLDTTLNGVSTEVSNAIVGGNLTISMGGKTSNKAELTLNNTGGNSTIKALSLSASSSAVRENVLNLNANKTTITDDLSIDSSKGLTINLANSTELASRITNQGATNLNFNGSDGLLTGAIGTDGASAITTIKITDGKSGTISGAVTTTNGATTNIDFASGSGAKTLTLGASGNTITAIVLGSTPSTNNTLALNNGTTTISNAVSVDTNQALAFTLNDNTTLDLKNGLATNATGTTTFNLGSNDASATTTTLVGDITNNGTNTFNVNSATTTLKYGANGLAFSSGVNEINFTNTSENGATLDWKDSSGTTQAISTSGGTTQINFTNNGTISGGVSTSDSGSTTLAISNSKIATITGNISTSGGNTQINFNGESGTLASAISTTDGTTSISISDNAVATITDNITTGTAPSGNKARAMRIEDAPTKPATNIVFKSTKTGEKLSKSTLILQGSTNQITTLTMGAGENILALMQNGDKQEYTDRNATIENLDNTANGKLRLVSQISTNDANTFTINDATFSTSKEAEVNQDDAQQNTPKLTGHISLILSDGVDTNQVGKESAILVASVKDGIGVAFEETSEFADGFLIKKATFTTNDDGDYTKYFLGSITTQGIATSEQKAIASAFMLDYNLYMANLNSLNRRMGELRENAHSQGVWARVFNGGLSNEFGLGSKSNYTTIQAGYDYAFGSEGANNYLGFALSYALSFATSDSKATDSATGEVVGLDNIYSNAVEVALYNSYVSDSGWYNDTIAKFSYIMSSFDIQASGVSEARASDTKNYALTLSNEVGYAIRFGEMSEWSITPQVEATFGYFSQSDFKQNLSDNSQYLDSKADSVLTLRARAGSAFTYDFRAFTQKSGFNASLYVGAFYEYDYVNGGDISMVVSDGTTETQKSDIGSDGRVVMNVGTNMTIQDNTRLYFDFEKSFMGKINTDYQVNFGVRYSFGESDGYTPILEKSDYKAPLKLEGEESKEGDKEVKEGEEKQGEDKVKEGEKKEKTQKTKDKGSKSASRESKNTKTTKTLAKTQPKEKPSK